MVSKVTFEDLLACDGRNICPFVSVSDKIWNHVAGKFYFGDRIS